MSEDHSMPVGQIEDIFLALEDGYQRHMGPRVEKMSDVFSPFNQFLGMYSSKCVFVITRCCVYRVDVSKNHAQNSRHPTSIISFTLRRFLAQEGGFSTWHRPLVPTLLIVLECCLG